MQFAELARKANLPPATVITFSLEPNTGDVTAFWTGAQLVDIDNERPGKGYVFEEGWEAFHTHGPEGCRKGNVPFVQVPWGYNQVHPQEVLNAVDEADRDDCYLWVVTNPTPEVLYILAGWTSTTIDGKQYVVTGRASVWK